MVNSTLRDTIFRAAVDHVAEHGPNTLSFRKLAADAWLASDLEKVLASYHDDIELHYMGESPLAGTHRGRDAAFAALGQASVRTSRKLIAVEELGEPPRRVRRVLLYRVQDEKLRECWLFDENQRFIDGLWSKEG
ncbi:MAG: nuclear transport factor 2 family protein [Actinomycetota bacterium]